MAKTATREKPLIFSAPMVRAILDGTKTQTRRVMKIQPPPSAPLDLYVDERWGLIASWPGESEFDYFDCHCPYPPGDFLWVRETWRAVELTEPYGQNGDWGVDGIRFKADGHFEPIENTQEASERWCDAYDNGKHGDKWRPSIYMKKWMARIWLEVTGVRVERLQEIGPQDVRAEGIALPGEVDEQYDPLAFGQLWDEINAKRGYSWESNPWVWVIEFQRIKP